MGVRFSRPSRREKPTHLRLGPRRDDGQARWSEKAKALAPTWGEAPGKFWFRVARRLDWVRYIRLPCNCPELELAHASRPCQLRVFAPLSSRLPLRYVTGRFMKQWVWWLLTGSAVLATVVTKWKHASGRFGRSETFLGDAARLGGLGGLWTCLSGAIRFRSQFNVDPEFTTVL